MVPVNDEIMAFGFATNRFKNGITQKLVAYRSPQGRAQIRRIFLAETHVKRARTRQPHPVATLAEIMGERRDKA